MYACKGLGGKAASVRMGRVWRTALLVGPPGAPPLLADACIKYLVALTNWVIRGRDPARRFDLRSLEPLAVLVPTAVREGVRRLTTLLHRTPARVRQADICFGALRGGVAASGDETFHLSLRRAPVRSKAIATAVFAGEGLGREAAFGRVVRRAACAFRVVRVDDVAWGTRLQVARGMGDGDARRERGHHQTSTAGGIARGHGSHQERRRVDGDRRNEKAFVLCMRECVAMVWVSWESDICLGHTSLLAVAVTLLGHQSSCKLFHRSPSNWLRAIPISV